MTTKMASVHRFGNKVALFVGSSETVYLSLDEAEALARHLSAAASDVREVDFMQSVFRPVEITLGG